MLGRIIGVFITGTTGILIAVLDLLLRTKEKINLLHDYHVDKVNRKTGKPFVNSPGSASS
jgi:hypothetical protein